MERYDILAVQDTPQEDVLRALLEVHRRRGFERPDARGLVPEDEVRSFEISPATSRYTVVFAEEPLGDDVPALLSRALSSQVLHLQATEGEPVPVGLYEGGARSAAPGAGEAPVIPRLRDLDRMRDGELDQEVEGYRRLVLRKGAAFGFLHRIRLLFAKPDLGPAAR